jgi:hypothetical protein
MRARHYDPQTGHFLQRDPMQYEDSVNLYAAMANNPSSYRDPTGMSAENTVDAVKKFLNSRGLTDMEVDAITNVLKRRGDDIRLSIRDFGTKAAPRKMHAEAGLPNKPAFHKSKNNGKALGTIKGPHGKRKVTSDLDALHLSINGRMASHEESLDLFRDINREYGKLFREAFEGTGKKVNAPFQHGAHTGMVHLYGKNFLGKTLDDGYLAEVGHPGDSFTISFTKEGNGLSAFDTPRSQTHADILEAESILKQKQMEMGRVPQGFPGFRASGDWESVMKDFTKKRWMAFEFE